MATFQHSLLRFFSILCKNIFIEHKSAGMWFCIFSFLTVWVEQSAQWRLLGLKQCISFCYYSLAWSMTNREAFPLNNSPCKFALVSSAQWLIEDQKLQQGETCAYFFLVNIITESLEELGFSVLISGSHSSHNQKGLVRFLHLITIIRLKWQMKQLGRHD